MSVHRLNVKMSAGNRFNIRLLALLVALPGVISSVNRSVHASCGDYLHTRFGPPAGAAADIVVGVRSSELVPSRHAELLRSLRQQLAATSLTSAVLAGDHQGHPDARPAGCHGPECGQRRTQPPALPVVPWQSHSRVDAVPPAAGWSMLISRAAPHRSGSQQLPDCVQPRPATPPPDPCAGPDPAM